MVELKGVIGVASAAFVERAIEKARAGNAPLVIIRMDTPGGLLSATREIIGAILESPVPVAVHVAPGGARAASAGTYIVYASHIAAMAPGTHIGAATPVSLGAPPGLPGNERPPPAPKEKSDRPEPANAGERKAINDAVAYLRTLAQLRGRNADFAERAVRDAATMTATEAQAAGVVELLVATVEELLAAVDGRKITVHGAERTLATRNSSYEMLSPDWRVRLIGIVTDPNVAYLLLILGFYGILFEIWNPGFIFPGVFGGIALLTALAALAVLPVSYAGLALIMLGVALMVAELLTPGLLVLGIGGIAAFIIGSVFLFDPEDVSFGFGVSWPVVAAATATTAVFMFVVLGLAVRARRRAVVTGIEEMIGSVGRVVDWSGDTGRVHVHGESWQARLGAGQAPLPAGARVRVVALDGLTVIVEPVANPEPARR
ncbi:MAG TPA: nodulation protein NfeD [Alphaproteobacteria bacterium]|nr:nodulation protein NfeD [Alphaproteobacteria bacterium]